MILLIPLIIVVTVVAFIIFGISNAYDFLFELIRRDPRIKLSQITVPIEREFGSISELEKYYESNAVSLSEAIPAHSSKLTIDSDEDWTMTEQNNDPKEFREHRITWIIETNFATAKFSTATIEERFQGSSYWYGIGYDDNYPDLGGIRVAIEFKNEKDSITFDLGEDRAEWFLVSIMRGDYKVNGSQFWAYLKEKDVSIVRYKDEGSWYGLRSEYEPVHARQHWIDTKLYND